MRFETMVLVAVLAGCASSGTKVTAEDMANFKAGQATESQVIARFGVPNNVSTGPDGTKTDMYIFAQATANAADYIPVVGLLAGGSTSKTTTATFVFDTQGLLKSTSSGQGHSNLNTGLLNQ